LPFYEQEKNKLVQEIDRLSDIKKELKSHTDEQLIETIDYQKAVNPISKAIKELEYKTLSLFDIYFKEHFTNTIPISSQDEVIQFIKKVTDM
jgi:hypothetical protein